MLVRIPTSYDDQGFLPMSFNEVGDNLHWHPRREQPYIGHSNQGKYNSAYSIGFCCVYLPKYVYKMLCVLKCYMLSFMKSYMSCVRKCYKKCYGMLCVIKSYML